MAKAYHVDAAVLVDRVSFDAVVQTASGRILALEDPGAVEAGVAVERLEGTLFPGFVDLQVNGAGGASVDEGTDEALDLVADAVAAGGAVAFLPTLITAPWEVLRERTRRVADWVARRGSSPRPGAAFPLGIHLEGPFLEVGGAHDTGHFRDPTPEAIAALLDDARGFLRMVTLAPGRPGAAAAVAQLREARVAVSFGHADEVDGLASCVRAGATMATHLFNAMSPLHHRDLGVVGAVLDSPELSASLVVDGAHVDPAVVRTAWRALGVDRTILVTDAVAAAGMPDGNYRLGEIELALEGGVVRDPAGRLAGSALTMGAAVDNLQRFVPAVGDWAAARAAAWNPAAAIGAGEFGGLETGRRAVFSLRGRDGAWSVVGLDGYHPLGRG